MHRSSFKLGVWLARLLIFQPYLTPRPHPRAQTPPPRRKRVWWTWEKSLGLHWGISTRQSDRNSGTVIWLAYHRNVTSLYLLYKPNHTHNHADQSDPSIVQLPIACAAIQTNEIQALHGLVSAHHRMRTEIQPKLEQDYTLCERKGCCIHWAISWAQFWFLSRQSDSYHVITQCACARGKVIGLYVYCLLSSSVRKSPDLEIQASERLLSTTNLAKLAKNGFSMLWLVQHSPWTSQIVCLCWPCLSTTPTAGHVLSAHALNWPSISR